MTEKTSLLGSESRRSFVKKGALAGSALALGGTGAAAAQQTETPTETPAGEGLQEIDGLVQASAYRPGGRFMFVSGVVDWTPDVPGVANDVWADYNTYMIRWLNTNQIVPLWIEGGAVLNSMDDHLGYIPDDEAGDQPELYEMQAGDEDFEDGDQLIQVALNEVPQEPAEAILEQDEWWQDDSDNGTPTDTPST